MDLSVVLEATQPVVVSFCGETINLEAYTAGNARLTKEQRTPLTALFEGDNEARPDIIEAARLALPLLVKSWDVNWKGAPLPIETINDLDAEGKRKYAIPDMLILRAHEALQAAVEDPMNGSEPPQPGSQPAEKPEIVLAETTTS